MIGQMVLIHFPLTAALTVVVIVVVSTVAARSHDPYTKMNCFKNGVIVNLVDKYVFKLMTHLWEESLVSASCSRFKSFNVSSTENFTLSVSQCFCFMSFKKEKKMKADGLQ